MQLCKLSPVQAMKLTKMRQKRLLPYLICNYLFRQLNNLPPTDGTTEQEIFRGFLLFFYLKIERRIEPHANQS